MSMKVFMLLGCSIRFEISTPGQKSSLIYTKHVPLLSFPRRIVYPSSRARIQAFREVKQLRRGCLSVSASRKLSNRRTVAVFSRILLFKRLETSFLFPEHVEGRREDKKRQKAIPTSEPETINVAALIHQRINPSRHFPMFIDHGKFTAASLQQARTS